MTTWRISRVHEKMKAAGKGSVSRGVGEAIAKTPSCIHDNIVGLVMISSKAALLRV